MKEIIGWVVGVSFMAPFTLLAIFAVVVMVYVIFDIIRYKKEEKKLEKRLRDLVDNGGKRKT
jgi:protein-S-isoprenylcysteine O-methyltransferase Ste14